MWCLGFLSSWFRVKKPQVGSLGYLFFYISLCLYLIFAMYIGNSDCCYMSWDNFAYSEGSWLLPFRWCLLFISSLKSCETSKLCRFCVFCNALLLYLVHLRSWPFLHYFAHHLPYWNVQEEIAREFGIPVQFQRFWLWAKRQNHTYRPNRPLTSLEETQSVMFLTISFYMLWLKVLFLLFGFSS